MISSSPRRILELMIVLSVAVFLTTGGESVEPHRKVTRIVVLGDSLSAAFGIRTEKGWVTLLAEQLKEEGLLAAVENSAVSGNTTSDGLGRLDRLLTTPVDLMVIELGVNDMLRQVDPVVTRDNLLEIVGRVRAKNAKAVILIAAVQFPTISTQFLQKEHHAVQRDVARSAEAVFIENLLDGVSDDPEKMLGDELHPNEQGQERIYRNIWAVLRPILLPQAA